MGGQARQFQQALGSEFAVGGMYVLDAEFAQAPRGADTHRVDLAVIE